MNVSLIQHVVVVLDVYSHALTSGTNNVFFSVQCTASSMVGMLLVGSFPRSSFFCRLVVMHTWYRRRSKGSYLFHVKRLVCRLTADIELVFLHVARFTLEH